MTIFSSDSSWGSVYSVLGVMIMLIGVAKLTKKFKFFKRLLICAAFFVLSVGILIGIDYVGVVQIQQPPRFTTCTTFSYLNGQDIIYYDTPFYDVMRINPDTENERYIVRKNKMKGADIIDYQEEINSEITDVNTNNN